MVTASLRWHHRLEWQLGQLLDRPLPGHEAELAALLRIGLTQLEHMRTPEHAAVAATVSATEGIGRARARGLVNAVLRRYLRERHELAARAADVPVARFSHPAWLIDTLRADWPDRWESILDANNVLPPLWLRVNRRRTDVAAYLRLLAAAEMAATASPDYPDAVLLETPCAVERLPGFFDGLVSVQDAAAQRAAELLDLRPGARVLDACAAPGGKTAHMLERCAELGIVVAIDSDADRLAYVAETLSRLGLQATLIEGDAARPLTWFDGAPFDRILVDAPCSATGVIRRHPDIKVLRRSADIAELAAGQAAMLDALWPLLKPGGRLVYATCSVVRAENLDVAAPFAARTPDAALPPFGTSRHLQLLPGEANTDGFYYACLDKLAGGNN